ncbi:MAG: hypothetical protein ACRD3T_19255, partial [Terriglobia bacterium]
MSEASGQQRSEKLAGTPEAALQAERHEELARLGVKAPQLEGQKQLKQTPMRAEVPQPQAAQGRLARSRERAATLHPELALAEPASEQVPKSTRAESEVPQREAVQRCWA